MNYSSKIANPIFRTGGFVVQGLAHEVSVVSSILDRGSFLVRGSAVSLTLAELYDQ